MKTIEPFQLPENGALDVPDVYYRRHLGLPQGAQLEDRLVELTEQARTWYRDNAEPWTTARQFAIEKVENDVIYLEQGIQLNSPVFSAGLAHAQAEGLVVVAATAGEAVDQKIAELWKGDRPDEAMFLNSYAIAAVEHLRWTLGEHLFHGLQAEGSTLLPHYSPGYEGWELGDQQILYKLLFAAANGNEKPISILSSGCLTPLKSTLAAYGITKRTDLGKLDDYWTHHVTPTDKLVSPQTTTYAFPKRALARWQEKRLSLTVLAGGNIEATFRTDGSTCTNMGVPLVFIYQVTLQKEDENYRITKATCTPSENNKGYQSMCAYLNNPERFMMELDDYHPLVGKELSEAITWDASTSPAGCLCTRPSQDHKWRIVFQTIHFALEKE